MPDGIPPPELQSVKGLYGASKTEVFEVPHYQRHFVWPKEQIHYLFDDLFPPTFWQMEHACRENQDLEPKHRQDMFLGCVVLCSSETGAATQIVDGQQRSIALAIVLHHLYRRLKILKAEDSTLETAEDEVHLLEVLRAGPQDRIGDRGQRLQLRSEDAQVWRDFVGEADLECHRGGDSKLLVEANDAVIAMLNLQQERAIDAGLQPSAGLQVIIRRFLHDNYMIRFTTKDEIQAFTLFESLNYRGVPLDAADLTKNKLLQLAHRHSQKFLEEVRADWGHIVKAVGRRNTQQFLHHYWIGHHGPTGKPKLFDKVREYLNENRSESSLRRFVKSIRSAAVFYGEANSPDLMKNNSNAQKLRRAAYRRLNRLGAKTVFIPLLVCQSSFKQEEPEILTVLEAATVMGFFGSINSRDVDRAYKDACAAVRGDDAEFDSLAEALKVKLRAMRRSGALARSISDTPLTGSGAKLRAVLSRFEQQIGGLSEIDLLDEDSIDVEHVHPQDASLAVCRAAGFSTRAEEREHLNLIGNLTLFYYGPNRSVGNVPLEDKRDRYVLESKVEMTIRLGRAHKKWTKAKIRARTKELAILAERIWEI